MRKRVDINPNHDDLIKLLCENPLGRNLDLVSFMNELSETEAPYTYFIDGDWGSGKTIFVKQLIVLMELINEVRSKESKDGSHLKDALGDAPVLNSLIAEISTNPGDEPRSKSLYPVYYNAWENDHWNNPLPSLIRAIAWGVGLDGQTKNKPDESTAIKGLIGDIMKLVHLDETASGISGEDLLSDYDDHNVIRGKIKKLVQDSTADNASKLVLIIDELDRCRPTFALELLEQVKTLFDHQSLITIFAVNSAQLARTIEGCYGPGFNGNRYLAKFYDHLYTLQDPSSCDYLSYLGLKRDYGRSYPVAKELSSHFSMSLRDRNRYVEAIMRGKRFWVSGASQPGFLGEQVIATALIGIKISNPDSFRKIATRIDADEFYDNVLNLESFWKYLNALTGRYPASSPISETLEDRGTLIRKRVLADYLVLIFGTDFQSDDYKLAAGRLFPDGWNYGILSHISNILYC